MSAPEQGFESQLAIDAGASISVSSQPLEFKSCTLRRRDTQVDSNGIRGSRSRDSRRTRIVQRAIDGDLTLEPSATEIDAILPWILGGTTSGGVTDVADVLSARTVGLLRMQDFATFSGVYVSRLTINAQPGQPIEWVLSLVGKNETTGLAGSWPSLTYPTDNMFVTSDIVLTVNGTARQFGAFTFTLDNLIDDGRFLNSLTRTEISAQDRDVRLALSLPFDGDNSNLYPIASAGVAASVAISDGSTTYTIAMANVKAEAEGPTVPGKSELLLPLNLRSFHNGTDSEFKVTKS